MIANLSFSGAGFLGIYQMGAAAALREFFSHDKGHSGKFHAAAYIGTSVLRFGSVAAALLACDMNPTEYAPLFVQAARDTRRRPLRSLTPGFLPVKYVHDAMHAELPPDAHTRCEGLLLVSLSVRTPGGPTPFQNRLISSFPSRAFLADALSAACWIPGVTGSLLSLPRLGPDTVMDGTLTATLAASHPTNTYSTVFVSPFSNGCFDICPKHNGAQFKLRIPTGREFAINTWNLRALSKAVLTPTEPELQYFFQLGADNARRFIEDKVAVREPEPSCAAKGDTLELRPGRGHL